MSMIEVDIVTLALIVIVCFGAYYYCIKEKPYMLKYISLGYILLLVFLGL